MDDKKKDDQNVFKAIQSTEKKTGVNAAEVADFILCDGGALNLATALIRKIKSRKKENKK